jgi:hypothetical protein
MFYNASVFDQNLSRWCVTAVGDNYGNFDTYSKLTSSHLPSWKTCPAAYNSFDTTWKTTAGNEMVTVPLVNGVSYDFTIDW